MCTVTFIPNRDSVLITSNRDERYERSTALPPAIYNMSSGKILAPRDTQAGGTWFAVNENGNAVVFLNGAFKKHDPKPPYRKSRGLVAIELADHEHPIKAFKDARLHDIEPFTAIIYDGGLLFECRWDGIRKYRKSPDGASPHIWSSATLYDEAAAARRETWFREWLATEWDQRPESVLQFHQFTGDGDRYNDLVIDRDGLVFTVSITSARIGADAAGMEYLDFKNQQQFHQHLSIKKSVAIHP